MRLPARVSSACSLRARAHPALVALMLIVAVSCWSEDAAATDVPDVPTSAAPAPDATAGPPTPDVVAPMVRHQRPTRRLTAAQSIDESVRRLSRGLDLDPGQQLRLRQILVDQRRQMVQLRAGGSAASGNVTGTMRAIYDQTRARIHSMLNEEQLKKYPAAVPPGQTAPAQADLNHWLQQQETKRTQANEVSQ